MRTLQPYQQYPAPAPAAAPPTPIGSGTSSFVKALPAVVSSVSCALGYVWHLQGGAHSIGDAAVAGLFALAFTWAGHRMAGAGANIPASVTAAAYGLGAGLGGIAVTAYANAPVVGLIAWLAGTVIAYALASTGWTRRAERRAERAHERDLLVLREEAKTLRTQIKADAQVTVAKELSSAWAAEHAARADFDARYPSPVPLFGQVTITQTPKALDFDQELRALTGETEDPLALPDWLTDPARREMP